MKTNILIGGLLMGIILWACGDNDESPASHLEKNWFTIEYDPNAGELDQLIYEIYDETGFPIFYNDTLGTQIRYDHGGNPYEYYEIFKTGYSYSGQASERYYTLQRDENKILLMVELLRDYVLEPYMVKDYSPNFKGRYGALGFLLLDTLLNENRTEGDSLYHGMGITALSTRYLMKRGKDFVSVDELTEEEKERFGWNLAIYELKRYFEVNYTAEIQAYYDVTLETPDHEQWKDGKNLADIFEITDTGKSYNYKNKPGYNEDFTTNPRRYGVLKYMNVDNYNVRFPSKLGDLMDFTWMIYTMSDAEIRAEHGEFPMIIKRYEMLRELLESSEMTQFIKGDK